MCDVFQNGNRVQTKFHVIISIHVNDIVHFC
jgi:hypothetical protein